MESNLSAAPRPCRGSTRFAPLPDLFHSHVWALLPLAILAVCLLVWAVDVLIWDEWILWTRVLEKQAAGVFGWLDLAAQQNEQRNLAARLVGLAFMPVFGLSRRPEYVLNVLLAVGCLIGAGRLFRLTARGRVGAPWLAFSLLAFSLLQWEAFSVGINSSVLLPVLGIWIGACLAAAGPPTTGRLAALSALGLIPAFSFVNGLFYWPCLWPQLVRRAETRAQRLAALVVWPLIGALVWGVYFTGFQHPGHHPSWSVALGAPLRLGGYFLAYLGGTVVSDHNLLPLAMAAGAFSLALLALFVPAALRQGRAGWDMLLAWSPPLGFGLASALATAVGRSGFGLVQAQESRYATFSAAYWMALIGLWVLLGPALPRRLACWIRWGLAACLGLLLASSVCSSLVLRSHCLRQERGRAEIYRLRDAAALRGIFPDPVFLAAKLPLFLERRVGPYHFLRPLEEYEQLSGTDGAFALEPGLGPAGELHGLRLTGNLDEPGAAFILLADAERTVWVARSDDSGRIDAFMPDTALAPGSNGLRAFVLRDSLDRALRPLRPEVGVEVVNSPLPVPFHVDKYFLSR